MEKSDAMRPTQAEFKVVNQQIRNDKRARNTCTAVALVAIAAVGVAFYCTLGTSQFKFCMRAWPLDASVGILLPAALALGFHVSARRGKSHAKMLEVQADKQAEAEFQALFKGTNTAKLDEVITGYTEASAPYDRHVTKLPNVSHEKGYLAQLVPCRKHLYVSSEDGTKHLAPVDLDDSAASVQEVAAFASALGEVGANPEQKASGIALLARDVVAAAARPFTEGIQKDGYMLSDSGSPHVVFYTQNNQPMVEMRTMYKLIDGENSTQEGFVRVDVVLNAATGELTTTTKHFDENPIYEIE